MSSMFFSRDLYPRGIYPDTEIKNSIKVYHLIITGFSIIFTNKNKIYSLSQRHIQYQKNALIHPTYPHRFLALLQPIWKHFPFFKLKLNRFIQICTAQHTNTYSRHYTFSQSQIFRQRQRKILKHCTISIHKLHHETVRLWPWFVRLTHLEFIPSPLSTTIHSLGRKRKLHPLAHFQSERCTFVSIGRFGQWRIDAFWRQMKIWRRRSKGG